MQSIRSSSPRLSTGSALFASSRTGRTVAAVSTMALIASFATISVPPPFTPAALSCLLAGVVLYAFGAIWLAQDRHLGAMTTFRKAVLPSIPGNLFQVAAASGSFTSLRNWHRR